MEAYVKICTAKEYEMGIISNNVPGLFAGPLMIVINKVSDTRDTVKVRNLFNGAWAFFESERAVLEAYKRHRITLRPIN